MHQAPVRKDDWLGGGGQRRGRRRLPERSEEQREGGLKQEEEKQDGTTTPRPEAERAGDPGTPRHQAAPENPPAEKTAAAAHPVAEPPVAADPVSAGESLPAAPVAPAEIVRVLPPPAAAEPDPDPDPMAAAAALEAWDDPGPDERRTLHPLPRGLVELYGVLAVLLVLVPEWLADTLLERANISRGNPLMPFSVAWRRDPELLMGRMTLWQLRTLAQRLGLRHYARNHREQLVGRLLLRMARMDAQGLDALAQSLKQR